MNLINLNKLPKWQQNTMLSAINIAKDFIIKKYNIENFNDVSLKFSSTARGAYYMKSKKLIRISTIRRNIFLYDRKTIGEYKRFYKDMMWLDCYATQLIHELTHYVQHRENRKFSEIETTMNELEYLKQKGIATI